MKHITGSATVSAPLEAVWDLMNDVPRYAEWAAPTDRVLDMDPGPIGVGYTYREYGGIPPFKGESNWRVTQFEPMTHQRHVGDDGMTTTDLLIELEPNGQGTQLTMTVDLKTRWFITPVLAVLWPVVMKKRSQEAIRQTLDNVKKKLGSSI